MVRSMAGLQSTTSHSKYTDTEVWWPFCCEIIDVVRPGGSACWVALSASNPYDVAAQATFPLSLLSKQNLIYLDKGALSKKTEQASKCCFKEFCVICNFMFTSLCKPTDSIFLHPLPLTHFIIVCAPLANPIFAFILHSGININSLLFTDKLWLQWLRVPFLLYHCSFFLSSPLCFITKYFTEDCPTNIFERHRKYDTYNHWGKWMGGEAGANSPVCVSCSSLKTDADSGGKCTHPHLSCLWLTDCWSVTALQVMACNTDSQYISFVHPHLTFLTHGIRNCLEHYSIYNFPVSFSDYHTTLCISEFCMPLVCVLSSHLLSSTQHIIRIRDPVIPRQLSTS